MSLDLAEGSGGDYTIMNLFEVRVKDTNIYKLYNDENADIKKSDFFQLYQVGRFRSNTINLENYLRICREVGFGLHNLLCWEKNNCTPSQYYMKNCEYVLFLRKGKAKWINDIGGSKTVHQFNNIIGKKTHPCEKPVDLLKFYIANSSNEGDIVFDPFSGTGSTLVAAKELNRQWLGYEIDGEYYNIALNKLTEK